MNTNSEFNLEKYELKENYKISQNINLDEDEENSWKDKLLKIIRELEPVQFERLCKRLFQELGFIKVYNTQLTRDGGVDGFGIFRNSIISYKVAFECKKYKEENKISADILGKLRNAMKINHINHGFVLTTSSFTKDATNSAESLGDIDLIDGDELCNLIKKVQLGVKTIMVEEIQINQDYFRKI